MSSPGRMIHSSNQTRTPAPRSRSASRRTRALSLELWLRKTSKEKLVGFAMEFSQESGWREPVPLHSTDSSEGKGAFFMGVLQMDGAGVRDESRRGTPGACATRPSTCIAHVRL